MSRKSACPFYTVWREGGGAPVVQHPNQHEAEREAERLARIHSPIAFWVMAPLTRFQSCRMTVDHYEPDSPPF